MKRNWGSGTKARVELYNVIPLGCVECETNECGMGYTRDVSLSSSPGKTLLFK